MGGAIFCARIGDFSFFLLVFGDFGYFLVISRLFIGYFLAIFRGYFTKSRNACGKEVLDCVGMRVLAQWRHESSRTHEELIHARAIMPNALKYT